MKCIIAGSRNINDYDIVVKAIKESGFAISEIVSGEANGPDTIGITYGNKEGIKVSKFPARWDDTVDKPKNEIRFNKFGRAYWVKAGFVRNIEMAEYADALILVWDGKSSGSKDMLKTARDYKLQVFEKII